MLPLQSTLLSKKECLSAFREVLPQRLISKAPRLQVFQKPQSLDHLVGETFYLKNSLLLKYEGPQS